MKIETNAFKIEITPGNFYADGIKESEVKNFGSDVVKLLLERGINIQNIKITYTENEKI